MSENKQIPSLRFKGFTDPWEQRKLGDNSLIITGGTPSTSIYNYWNPKQIPWLSSGEIHKKIIFDTDDKISESGFQNSSAKWIKEYSVLIALAGQGKTRGTVAINTIKLTSNQSIAGITPNEELLTYFLYSYLEKNYSNIRLLSSQDGSRGGLNKVMIGNFDIPFTNLEEQGKIGNLFSNLDNLITLHQRKYDKLVTVKKSLLEKMFPAEGEATPKVRFKGFTDPWEQRKLGNIFKRVTRKNDQILTKIPLTISSKYGLVNQLDYFNNRVASVNLKNYYLIYNGEFAYNKSTSEGAPFGSIKRLDLYENGALSTLYIAFNLLNSQIFDSDYFMNFFSTTKWHKGIYECAAEGARNHGLLNIASDDFFNIKIRFPLKIKEQMLIGKYFNQLDNLITLHQRKLEKLKNIKKSLLNRMFV